MRTISVLIFSTLGLLISCSKSEQAKPKVNTDNKFVIISPSFDVPTLTSIWFFDEEKGSITTASNQILNTLDGGITWNTKTINGSKYLENLYYYDSNIGFCSDPNFKSFKFNEPLWSIYNFPVKETYVSCYQMLSEMQLFATTVKGNNDFSYLLNSNNGGAIWDTLIEYDANFKQILMLNENTGFILANGEANIAILKTNDGGMTWANKIASSYGTYYSSTTQLKRIIALDDNNLIAIGRGASSNQGFILTSTNGGEDWTFELINQALTHVDATDTDVFFVGTELFVARWKINTQVMDNPLKIVNSWITFNKDTDFLLSDNGDPVLGYPHVIQVQFTDTKTGFILTSSGSYVFKIKLNDN